MWYTVALFVHVLGAVALFVAVSLIVVAFMRMRAASTLEQVREWATVADVAGKSLAFIALIVLVPALYMVNQAWEFTTPWVAAALITFIAQAVLGAALSGRTIARVNKLAQAAVSGPVPAELRAQLLGPKLWLTEAVRLTLLIGILCLMTIKPDALFSVLVLAGMLLLGIILGVLMQHAPAPLAREVAGESRQ